MHQPTPPAHPAKPAHARGGRRGGSPSGRRRTRRIAMTAVVAAVAATAAVLGVTLRPGAGHTAVGSTRSTTKTPALPGSTAPPTTSRSTAVSTVPQSSVRSGTAPSSSGGSSPKSDRLPPNTTPTSNTPTSTAPNPVLSSTAPCTPVTVPGGVYAVGDSVMIDAQQTAAGMRTEHAGERGGQSSVVGRGDDLASGHGEPRRHPRSWWWRSGRTVRSPTPTSTP